MLDINVVDYTEESEVSDRYWHQGYRAFVDGESIVRNPYAKFPGAYGEWDKGWNAANTVGRKVMQ